MGILLASTVPPWWGPDEDYHWNYTSNIAESGKLPDPQKPFYSGEWNAAIVAENFNQFGTGPAPVTGLTGDPHAVDKELERKYGAAARKPTGQETRPVVHAPLYHAVAAAAVKPFSSKSVFTRLWIGRFVNALLAMLVVFAAWVLAAQVFSREGPRLFVAALAATQPMINYATGTMTNDAALTAFYTLSLAALVRVLIDRPQLRQGVYVGSFVALALLSKSSALLLVPVTLAVYGVQWLRNRELWREVLKSLGVVVGICAVVAGWFYVYVFLKYGSITGALVDVRAASDGAATQSLVHIPGIIWAWLQNTYSTYWFHYVFWEAPTRSVGFYVPLAIGAVGAIGGAFWAVRMVRSRRWRDDLVLKAVFLFGVAVLVILPWLYSDVIRGLHHMGFAFNGGRFIIPAYAANAVLLTIGLSELTRHFSARVHAVLIGLVAAASFLLSISVWKIKVLDRYFGGDDVPNLAAMMRRATFFRPEWVTPGLLWTLVVVCGLLAAAALLSGVWVSMREGEAQES
jgi:4-amino-4-deoxy-L-arabinose transferase-like glycosyltransferase